MSDALLQPTAGVNPATGTWQLILDLSRRMLERAEAGEWWTLTELEQQRRKALNKFFSQPQAMAEAEPLRQDIRQIQATDERVISLLRAAKERSARQLAQLANGRRAHTAYTQGLRRA